MVADMGPKFQRQEVCDTQIFTKENPNSTSRLLPKPATSCSTQGDLGILVKDNLKWSPHIINVVAKANRMLGFLRRNCFHLTDVRARRLLYLSLVRSHLSFGFEIWAPQGLSADLLRLEGIQRRATKFVLQDYETSYVDRLKKLNLINPNIILA